MLAFVSSISTSACCLIQIGNFNFPNTSIKRLPDCHANIHRLGLCTISRNLKFCSVSTYSCCLWSNGYITARSQNSRTNLKCDCTFTCQLYIRRCNVLQRNRNSLCLYHSILLYCTEIYRSCVYIERRSVSITVFFINHNIFLRIFITSKTWTSRIIPQFIICFTSCQCKCKHIILSYTRGKCSILCFCGK